MSEFSFLAAMILRHKFPIRQFDQSSLGRLLAQHCPDHRHFQVIEDSILLNLRTLSQETMTVPLIDTNGRWVQVLPRRALVQLVEATRAEVFRLLTNVCEEVAADSLRFESRTLYVRGREVAEWRDQDEGNRPQIDLLTAFQETKWASWIPNPLPSKQNYDDLNQVLRNLNRKLKKWLHFTQRDGRVFWSWR